jgi:hypothetical protein
VVASRGGPDAVVPASTVADPSRRVISPAAIVSTAGFHGSRDPGHRGAGGRARQPWWSGDDNHGPVQTVAHLDAGMMPQHDRLCNLGASASGPGGGRDAGVVGSPHRARDEARPSAADAAVRQRHGRSVNPAATKGLRRAACNNRIHAPMTAAHRSTLSKVGNRPGSSWGCAWNRMQRGRAHCELRAEQARSACQASRRSATCWHAGSHWPSRRLTHISHLEPRASRSRRTWQTSGRRP